MIDTSKWKEFIVGKIFTCETTTAVDADEVIDGDTIYITRSALNNGCSAFIQSIPEKIIKGNCITIGAEGKVAFYQDKEFLPGVKLYTLRNDHLNQNIGLFIATLLNLSVFKYSYGRARILEKIQNETILLPVKNPNAQEPDWDYMNKFMDSIQKAEKDRLVSLLDI